MRGAQKRTKRKAKGKQLGAQSKAKLDPKTKLVDETSGSEEYSFSPVLQSGKKVKINYTDMSKIKQALDTSKDVPLKKPQSAYVLFGNEVSDPSQPKSKQICVPLATSRDPGQISGHSSD